MAKAIAAVRPRQKLDMNQQCLCEGARQPDRQLLPVHPGLGLAHALGDQPAGRRGRRQWSGVVSAAAVAPSCSLFAPYARFIPRVGAGRHPDGVGLGMVDWRALAYHLRATRFDARIVAARRSPRSPISIEFCVLIGVFMSFLLAVPRAGRMLLTEFVVGADGVIHERLPDDEVCGRILIFGLEGEMFFGAAAALEAPPRGDRERASARTPRVRRAAPEARAQPRRRRHAPARRAPAQPIEERGVHVILVGVRGRPRRRPRSAPASSAACGAARIFREQTVRHTSTQKGRPLRLRSGGRPLRDLPPSRPRGARPATPLRRLIPPLAEGPASARIAARQRAAPCVLVPANFPAHWNPRSRGFPVRAHPASDFRFV